MFPSLSLEVQEENLKEGNAFGEEEKSTLDTNLIVKVLFLSLVKICVPLPSPFKIEGSFLPWLLGKLIR